MVPSGSTARHEYAAGPACSASRHSVVAGDDEPAAGELDADAGTGGVPRPTGFLHVLRDLDRLAPVGAIVGALADPDGARTFALAVDNHPLGVAAEVVG